VVVGVGCTDVGYAGQSAGVVGEKYKVRGEKVGGQEDEREEAQSGVVR